MATTRNIMTNVVINGINNLSGPVGKGVDKSISHFERMQNKMRAISYGAFNIGTTFAAGAAGAMVPLIYAGKKAVEFEDQMASVAKVANVEFGSSDFKAMGEEVKDLSEYLGMSAQSAGSLYETLATGGTARTDLAAIAKLAGQTAVAFDISAETAGTAFGYIKNTLGETVAQTTLTADAINALSNTRAAKAEKILTFLSAGGAAVARSFKMAGPEIAAMGATIIVNGKSGEEAATVMERFAKGVRQSAKFTKMFNAAGGGAKGFKALLEFGSRQKNPMDFFIKNFGMYGNDIGALAQTMRDEKGLVGALDLVADRTKIAGSAFDEFTAKQKATMSDIKKFWASAQRAVLDFGDALLPVMRESTETLKPFVKGLGDWVKENPKTVTALAIATAGFAALAATVAVGSFFVGGVATAFRAFYGVASFIIGRKTLMTLAAGLTDVFIASSILGFPVWGVVAAIAGLGYIAYKTSQDVMWLPKALTRVATGVWAFIKNVVPALAAVATLQFDKAIAISARADMEADMNYNKIWGTESVPIAPGSPKIDPAAYMQPKAIPLPFGGGGSTDSTVINFSPTMNFGNNVADDVRKQVETATRQAQDELEKRIRKIQEDQQRRSLK